MGLTDSKMVAEFVFGVCSYAENSGKDNITAMLTPKVLNLLHNLWSNLPNATKKKIECGMNKRKNRDRTENDPPGKVRRLKSPPDAKIALCPELMANVPAWIEAPLSFFNEGESKLELTKCPFDEMNMYMNKLTKRTGMDRIRLRLLKVMHYRLSERVGWTQLHQKRGERMAQTTSNADLLAWVNEGKRIDKLCRDIGCVEKSERSDQYFHLGNLFYSLQDVAESYIKELPLKDDPRPGEVARLRKRSGLAETEDRKKLDVLAHKLADTIWAVFQKAESAQEPEQHLVGGYSSSHDAQSSSHRVSLLQQEGGMLEEIVLNTGFPVRSTEVTTLDHEGTALNDNFQLTNLRSPLNGSVMHEGNRSVTHPTSRFGAHWTTNSESLHLADRPASLRPSSLSDFTDSLSSIHNVNPAFLNSTSLCPTTVSDFFHSNLPSSAQDALNPSSHPTSICPTSISDFITQASPSSQTLSLNAMSLYPTTFSDFINTTSTIQSPQPVLCPAFEQTASLSDNDTSLNHLMRPSQYLHVDVTDPVRGPSPVIQRLESELPTASTDTTQQIMPT
ncbi:hypothetical protein N7523_002037 [Penicillium sp. IBT 18751x]|nr:hypothetical protein N7523_002037 [Penicillium sp. IBT 18751x]